MNRFVLAAFTVLATSSAALAGTFSVSGSGGNVPDPLGQPGAWNVAFSGTELSSSITLTNPITSVTAIRLHGFRHTWRGDLHVYLRSPDGTKYNLIVRPGFDGANAGDFGDFVLGEFALVDGGTNLNQGGANLVSGDYAPYFNSAAGQWTNGMQNVPLAQIAGPAGVWRLVLEDWANMDTGAIAGWTLEGIDSPPNHVFCAGDGLDANVTTPCPCANAGAPGHGCGNSVNASGAELVLVGTTNPDTAVLSAQGMPQVAPAMFLQGDAAEDAVFGDGVRCAGGSLVRLRSKVCAGGAAQFPEVGDPALSVRGGVTPGSGATRYYQVYYRNASALFCPPETFNVSNGWMIVW
ncbi:MAG: proprotein convertase P-domain-containing protein [Planctomycetota bacterium]